MEKTYEHCLMHTSTEHSDIGSTHFCLKTIYKFTNLETIQLRKYFIDLSYKMALLRKINLLQDIL